MEHCRLATHADVERLVVLARELRAELVGMRGGTLWAGRDAAPEPLEERLAAWLEDPGVLVAAGCLDDVVVGYGVVEIERLRSGEALGVLRELFVEPDARAVGVGEAVVDQVRAFCEEHGCIGIDAQALPGHRATKNFFEEQGFTARSLTMHTPLGDPPSA